jgi:RNA polymerase sigma-70 factor (ECF subfamily)
MKGETNINFEKDTKIIEEMCSSTWETLYKFIYFKVQNREEAEDITQETYVKALSYMQKSNMKIDKYIAFLKTVSLNVLRDKWRKGKRLGTSVDIENINPIELSLEDNTEAFANQELIKSALKVLKEEYRTVIELRIIKGYSLCETAKIMDKTEGNISVLQYRALQSLSKIFKENNLIKEE